MTPSPLLSEVDRPPLNVVYSGIAIANFSPNLLSIFSSRGPYGDRVRKGDRSEKSEFIIIVKSGEGDEFI